MDERVEWALSKAAIWGEVKDKLGQSGLSLSGGQQQRLCIARTVAVKPSVILLDEPSLGLSPKLTKEIFEIVVRINRERGITLLIAESDTHATLALADYGYVMNKGAITQEGTVHPCVKCSKRHPTPHPHPPHTPPPPPARTKFRGWAPPCPPWS